MLSSSNQLAEWMGGLQCPACRIVPHVWLRGALFVTEPALGLARHTARGNTQQQGCCK